MQTVNFFTEVPEEVKGTDIQLAITSEVIANINRVLENRSKMLGRAGSYEFKGTRDFSSNRGQFTEPVYDLAEVARAADVEPYIVQSIRKHREQILKEGYIIKGPEDEMVSYIRKRFFEIALVSDCPTENWVRELVTNLVTFSNAFLILRRDSSRSGGKPITMYGKVRQPIAGIYVADPTTMKVTVDKYGTVKKWKQEIESLNYSGGKTDTKYFNPEDVIHITMDKKSGYTFGTPYLMPVLDDIRALRKLEELAIILASKEAFPLYHYKVGTETKPAMLYEDGSTEVDLALSQVAGLPAQGFIVTSERHEVTLVSRQGSSLDLRPYLDYFEARVLAGLRLAEIDLGRGGTANRGTASSISKAVQDSAKDYQQIISDSLTFKLILPLLLESGRFDVTEENLARFDFPMIDREELRAQQTHGLNMFLSNAITIDEFRKDYLNKEEMSEEQLSRTNRAHDLEGELKIIAATPRPVSSSGTTRSSSSSSKRRTQNLVQPRNQHKTLQTKKRITANDYKDLLEEEIDNLKEDILNKDEEDANKFDISSVISQLVDFAIPLVKESIDSGWREAKEIIGDKTETEIEPIGARALDRFHKNFMIKSFNITILPYIDDINSGNLNEDKVEDIRTALLKLIDIQLETSRRFGFVSLAKRMGYKHIEVIGDSGNVLRQIDLRNIIYSLLLPIQGDASLSLPTTN